MDKKALVEQFTRCNEANDEQGAYGMFAEDLVVHANVFSKPLNRQEEIDFSRSLHAQCAELRMEILSLEEHAEGVVRRMRATGQKVDGEPFDVMTEVLFIFNEAGQICEMRETIELGALEEHSTATRR